MEFQINPVKLSVVSFHMIRPNKYYNNQNIIRFLHIQWVQCVKNMYRQSTVCGRCFVFSNGLLLFCCFASSQILPPFSFAREQFVSCFDVVRLEPTVISFKMKSLLLSFKRPTITIKLYNWNLIAKFPLFRFFQILWILRLLLFYIIVLLDFWLWLKFQNILLRHCAECRMITNTILFSILILCFFDRIPCWNLIKNFPSLPPFCPRPEPGPLSL